MKLIFTIPSIVLLIPMMSNMQTQRTHENMDITKINQKNFIKDVLYKDTSYLQNRLSVFQYMTNPEHIWDWTWHRFPINQSSSILEVGCGFGTYWMQNSNRLPSGCTITLTGISPAMLEQCKKNLANYEQFSPTYAVADIEQLPFADNSFDIVFAHFVISYINSPLNALQELKRVVKSGGAVLIFNLHCDSRKELYEVAHQIDTRFPTQDVLQENFCQHNTKDYLDKIFPTHVQHTYTTDITIPSGESMDQAFQSMAAT